MVGAVAFPNSAQALSRQGLPVQGLPIQGQLSDALMAKLSALDPKTLNQLYASFFDASQKSGLLQSSLPQTFVPFACKTPTEALLANFASVAPQYHPQRAPESRSNQQQQTSSPKQQGANRFYGAKFTGPGMFSSPAAEKAAAALRQQQTQTLNFVNNQLGTAYATGNMSEFLGPNMCFEDALAAMLFKIADEDQRELLEDLRNYERGDQGLKGFMASGAKGVASAAGGVAGGLLGNYFSGPAGAATGASVGADVGERIANNFTGQYGSSSKAAQFERIKMKVNEMTQLIQMLSNVLHAFDSANRNTISNMRG